MRCSLEGIGGGTFLPIKIALVVDRCHPHERGRVLGLFMNGFDLEIALAGTILGVVVDRVGYRGAFGVASTLALAALIIFLALCSKDLSQSLRFALGQGGDVYALPKPLAE
ncbi:MFS transporter [Phormidesmis priestleyi]|uniref:MFS transporter n=1 Tax=Phormidesmis priestleyi TaxID=268141 RepID=UPI000934D697|nr:MFS transporter [Phormidesmis priestleyi]